jgi:sodium/bile acid cotransporter 7
VTEFLHSRAYLRFLPDPFILALLGTVALASVLPARGWSADFFAGSTAFAIGLLFFLHGAKLSREAILAGIGHWRLHVTVLAATFVLMPVVGLAIRALGHRFAGVPLLDGVLFLCLLPSTVQSSIAFTSIAGGNVPAAVCSASASNLLGMAITPLLVSLSMPAEMSGGHGGGLSLHAIALIALQLLLPFVAGHLARPMLLGLLGRYAAVVNFVDRGSILLVVYTAFSAAIVEGLWRKVSPGDLVLIAGLDAAVLALALLTTTWGARRLGFDRADEIAIVFCGSKKSLAAGVPMAGVLFPAAAVGVMILPVMLYHQMQLMVCAVLARRYRQQAPSSIRDDHDRHAAGRR